LKLSKKEKGVKLGGNKGEKEEKKGGDNNKKRKTRRDKGELGEVSSQQHMTSN